ncbi:MAG: carboxylating nicotinate-nucleotide diphosphorylase [Peptococcaceae bacterium]|nr:carboxylating nicotinate-nucleotide diphosphorylase [Peptococcaceae bacterium]
MQPDWDNVIKAALAEDLGHGDITTETVVPAEMRATARIVSKDHGIVAGLPVARRVFELLDPATVMEMDCWDGSPVVPGQTLATLSGNAGILLRGERVALNFLQHLSGIATQTHNLVKLVREYGVKILDTRKTTPGLRSLEKYAVRVGGGHNHRFGLYDGILIKDNHIAVAGSITEAIRRARAGAPHTLKIEVEVETLNGVHEALEAEADIIMLDNMSPETMRQAVQIVGGRCLLEASGGITTETVIEVARTGVDFISVGALTHSVRALDISMDIEL